MHLQEVCKNIDMRVQWIAVCRLCNNECVIRQGNAKVNCQSMRALNDTTSMLTCFFVLIKEDC